MFLPIQERDNIIKQLENNNEFNIKKMDFEFKFKKCDVKMKELDLKLKQEDNKGKFEVKQFIKFANCILNEFGFAIDSNRTYSKNEKKTIAFYNYKICPNIMNIISIINKY